MCWADQSQITHIDSHTHHRHTSVDPPFRYAPGVEFPDYDFHLRLSKELRAALPRLERALGGGGVI